MSSATKSLSCPELAMTKFWLSKLGQLVSKHAHCSIWIYFCGTQNARTCMCAVSLDHLPCSWLCIYIFFVLV